MSRDVSPFNTIMDEYDRILRKEAERCVEIMQDPLSNARMSGLPE
jgi:hypothetical protein